MLQRITRRSTPRRNNNGNRSPVRRPIRSNKSRSPSRTIFGLNPSPTSRNQRHLQSNHCVWILAMLMMGIIFHAGVLKWSMIHTEKEATVFYQNHNFEGHSQSITSSPYDHHNDGPRSTDMRVPYTDVKPLDETTKPNIRQKRTMSQPRHLTLSVNDEESVYYQVYSTLPQKIRLGSKRSQTDMILPILQTEPPESDPEPEQPQESAKTDQTLSPLQIRKEQCIPQESWQTDYLINCNQLHELDMVSESIGSKLNFLGQGWFRAAWKFSFDKYSYETDGEGTKSVTISQEGLVLKTLRIEREFLDEYYELHRRDAVAMERLTWSEFVMDVYGYCGQSALNELAYFKNEINNLEQLDRAMRNVKQKEKPDREKVEYMKLKLASNVATGLSHVHQVHSPSSIASGKETLPSKALMAHYDINPRNIAIVAGGKPKLNDFNIAEFIQYNPNTNQSCGFPSRLHEPWWRAPEEMYMPEDVEVDMRLVTEKVDIYALGAVLFHILTTHSPRGKMKKERMDEVREVVAKGIAPTLPAPFNISDSPAVLAIRQAMELCFVVDPEQRGSAHQVAEILQKAVKVYEEGGSEED